MFPINVFKIFHRAINKYNFIPIFVDCSVILNKVKKERGVQNWVKDGYVSTVLICTCDVRARRQQICITFTPILNSLYIYISSIMLALPGSSNWA